MFIAVVGLPGVGKTKVIEKLHELDTGSIIVNEDLKFEESEEFRKYSKDLNIKAHYYYDLSKLIYLSEKVKKLDYKNHNVYVEGYFVQNVAFYRAAGLDVNLDYEKYGLLKPDITIMIEICERTRTEREKLKNKKEKKALNIVKKTFNNDDEFINKMEKSLFSLIKRSEKLTFYNEDYIDTNIKILAKEIARKENLKKNNRKIN